MVKGRVEDGPDGQELSRMGCRCCAGGGEGFWCSGGKNSVLWLERKIWGCECTGGKNRIWNWGWERIVSLCGCSFSSLDPIQAWLLWAGTVQLFPLGSCTHPSL